MPYCGGYLWLLRIRHIDFQSTEHTECGGAFRPANNAGTVSKRGGCRSETILPQITAQQYPIHLARVTENHLAVKRSQSRVEANGS